MSDLLDHLNLLLMVLTDSGVIVNPGQPPTTGFVRHSFIDGDDLCRIFTLITFLLF